MTSANEIDKVFKSENIQANMMRRYMMNQATKIATKLHKLYPEKFTKLDSKNELLVLGTYLSNCRIVINTDAAVAKSNVISTKKIISKPTIIPEDEVRCCARVWDVDCIKVVKKETGEYINYGRRCNKSRYDNSDYCKIHTKKNSHGDYRVTDVPSHLKTHFEKALKKYGECHVVSI